jgi:hypothetical protein
MGFWEFLQEAGKVAKQANDTAFNFLKDTAQDIVKTPERIVRSAQEYYTAPAREVARKEVGRIESDPRLRQMVASSPKAAATFDKLKQATAPHLNSEAAKPGSIRQFLYGDEPVTTYQSQSDSATRYLEGTPLKPVAGPLGFLAGATSFALDVTPNPLKSAAKQTAKKLAKETTEEGVKKVLKGQVPDEVAERIAPSIAKTQDTNVIENIISKESTPTAAPDPFDDIGNAINGKPASKGEGATKGLKTISAENSAALRAERGKRFTASKAAGESAEGSQGYFKELSQLKGEYGKTKVGGLIGEVGPDRAEELFGAARKKIQSVPDETYRSMGLHPQAARLNTQTAIRKIIFGEGGGVPTQSELKLLQVVAPNLAKDVGEKIPKYRALLDFGAKLLGVPRALQTTLDLSMGGRQGLLVAARHPVIWGKANVESIKYLKDGKYFQKEMEAIRSTPEYAAGQKYGLATPAADQGAEEAYAAADLAKKIPVAGKVIDATQRAYDGGLTKMRSDLWNHTLKAYGGVEKAEKDLGAKGMTDLAEAINTLTGRGGKKGGLVEKHLNSLSATLFSPRLWASRLNTLNPIYYARLSPAARKVALENAGAFAAVAGVVLTAAGALGAKVETDPRSSDFLKIRVGDTRYDILGGLQQHLVFAARELTGQKKSTQTGEVTDLGDGFGADTRLDVATDFARNKLNPILGTGATLLEGKGRGGEDVDPLAEIARLFTPITLQGIYDSARSTGSPVDGVVTNIPNVFGVGTQTYGTQDINLSDKNKAKVESVKQKAPEKAEATERFYQTLKTTPSKDRASERLNEALAAGDQEEAIRIAKEYNDKYAASFKRWKEKYGQFAKDPDLVKEYNAGKLKLTKSSLRRRLKNIKSNPLYAQE